MKISWYNWWGRKIQEGNSYGTPCMSSQFLSLMNTAFWIIIQILVIIYLAEYYHWIIWAWIFPIVVSVQLHMQTLSFLKTCTLIVDCHLHIGWSIPEIFWIWSNDWNFLWKHGRNSIFCRWEPYHIFTTRDWAHWSFKCGFAAFIVTVGYYINLLRKCPIEQLTLYVTREATLRKKKITYHWNIAKRCERFRSLGNTIQLRVVNQIHCNWLEG